MKDELVERAKRWAMNTGYGGTPESVPMVMIDRIESLEAKLEKAREVTRDLVGQIEQARDGFGIWPYAGSQSMAETLAQAKELFQ